MTTRTVKELIDRYGIRAADGGKIFVREGKLATKDNALDELKARKAEILEHLAAEAARKEAAAAERARKIDEIEGLAEIKGAEIDLAQWEMEFSSSFEGPDACGGLGVRPMPQYDIAAMKAKYPRAAAYLRAEAEAYKTNYELSAIGRRALDEVIFGDYNTAMDTMEKEIADFSARHLMD